MDTVDQSDCPPKTVAPPSLRDQVRQFIVDTLESRAQPSAVELLAEIERELGWEARWLFLPLVQELRTSLDIASYLRDYLRQTLTDEEIRQALAGSADLKKEYRSTFDELVKRASQYRKSEAFREMIAFTARFRDYAPYNNMLVRIQNPSCAFYATERDWRTRFERQVKEDARPMLILAPMHPVMLVYGLDDTEGKPVPQKLLDFATATGEWKPDWLSNLFHNAERDRILVRLQHLSSTHGGFATTRLRDGGYKMRIGVHDELEPAAQFSILCHELAHIYLGHLGADKDLWWPCRLNLSHATVEIEAEAVAYIVSVQLGLKPSSEAYLSNFINGSTVPDSVSLELITKVAGKVLEMARRRLPARKEKSS